MALTPDAEKTILWCFVIGSIVGSCLMLISISTDYWVIVNIPNGVFRNATGGYVFKHNSGLWRICRSELYNDTSPVTISKSPVLWFEVKQSVKITIFSSNLFTIYQPNNESLGWVLSSLYTVRDSPKEFVFVGISNFPILMDFSPSVFSTIRVKSPSKSLTKKTKSP